MEEYPEYKFLQSQCHLYWMMKNHYPKLYARIKESVRKGQWIPDGGMWVEPDTNVTGGESLIRQFIHGKRFFKEEFGIESQLMWLPDVFGYSGALPQIMVGCGIKYFSTQKIFWNYYGGESFPYNLFWWEGIDGSKTLSYFHNDYNSQTNPTSIFQRWNERVQKDSTHPGRLVPFGHGDGGGGATRDHLEFLRRMENLQGAPKCHIGTPDSFFKKIRTDKIPTWLGELYFQAHRGTYTSQAKTKKGNRMSEFALREAEMWGVTSSVLAKFAYPLKEADSIWKTVLLNQFHDIIPGSSIAQVYVEAEASYAEVLRKAHKIAAGARTMLLKKNKDSITVFNSLSWIRDGIVELPSNFKGAEDKQGYKLQTQRHDNRTFALIKSIPSCGWTSIKNSTPPQSSSVSDVKATKNSLENELIKVVFNSSGEITSIIDKKIGVDMAADRCNSLRLYKDVPGKFDAWDIDSNYKLQSVEIPRMAEVRVTASGPLFASLSVAIKFGKSELSQEIILHRNSRRIDFRTKVDWNESHKLLKVNFPVNVRSEDALHEIQFGYIRRPTHSSKQYDADRFEVCNHKWTAIAEENRGAAVLNDCKYGVNVENNSINLTLLKSALAPDMNADKGFQEFTYSLYFWDGPLSGSRVMQESYELNVPLTTSLGVADTREVFGVDASGTIIETVKPAEDGSSDIVVRIYESVRSSVNCEFRTSLPVKKIYEADMLENIKKELALSPLGKVKLSFRPFEIKTLRLKI
jgi:alpha-mannosidase